MSIAAEIRLVKRRIDDYIWQDSSPPLRSLREFLEERIFPFSGAAIVGGLARDFALKGKRGFQSDIDIVIDGPAREVNELAVSLQATPNRFGGFSYKSERWKIDFWALESTWAASHGHVSISSLEDITRSTFFDCDAIVYDLKRRTLFADAEYLDRLRARTIEINLLPNPSINGNILRAVRRILFWNLLPGPKLSSFLCTNLSDKRFYEIGQIEKGLYSSRIFAQFDCADTLLQSLMANTHRHNLNTSFAEQMRLPEVL